MTYTPGENLPREYCPQCGHANPGTGNFCRNCGQHIVPPAAPPPPHAYAPAPLLQIHQQQPPLVQNVIQVAGWRGCPRCGSVAQPFVSSRISTGGWIVFALLLVFCFPLFWIGLLMKENFTICAQCGLPLS